MEGDGEVSEGGRECSGHDTGLVYETLILGPCVLNSNFKSSFARPKNVIFEEAQCSIATVARKDKHCLKKFYSMNKIVPGGLLRLKK